MLSKIFHKEKDLSLEKVILMAKFAIIIIKLFSKRNGYKGGYIIGFFNLPKKNLPAENVILMNGIAI